MSYQIKRVKEILQKKANGQCFYCGKNGASYQGHGEYKCYSCNCYFTDGAILAKLIDILGVKKE